MTSNSVPNPAPFQTPLCSRGLEADWFRWQVNARQKLTWLKRLVDYRGQKITLSLIGGQNLTLVLDRVGKDWLGGFIEGFGAFGYGAVPSWSAFGLVLPKTERPCPSDSTKPVKLWELVRVLTQIPRPLGVTGANFFLSGRLLDSGRDYLELSVGGARSAQLHLISLWSIQILLLPDFSC